mmetsp:Transcript_61193/g.108924  ORF Transcript_61193/g.108924 Transcript_61193/m.108924 type:complete len:99 (-) Transcript_61193:55-351(-)
MSDQKTRQVEQARELQAAIESMTSRSSQLENELNALGQERAANEQTLQQLNMRIGAISNELPQKSAQLQHLQQQQQVKEAEYMRLLEATPSLVHVLKR